MNKPKIDGRDLETIKQLVRIPAIDTWDVLSALRGPDDDSDINKQLNSEKQVSLFDIKEATTGVIRHALGMQQTGMLQINQDEDRLVALRVRLVWLIHTSHFIGHAYRAFHALGLSWGELNPPEKLSLKQEVIENL